MTGYDVQEENDVRLAYILLGGCAPKDKKGLPVQKYLRAGSSEELECRRALARLLSSPKPLDSLVRQLLAGLFDPTFAVKIGRDKFPIDRQIRFTTASRRSREGQKRLQIGHEIKKELESLRQQAKKPNARKVTAAVKAVAKAREISDGSAWNGWKEMRKRGWR
jgi:hypothetical protein